MVEASSTKTSGKKRMEGTKAMQGHSIFAHKPRSMLTSTCHDQRCPKPTSTTKTSRKWRIRALGLGGESLQSTTAPFLALLLWVTLSQSLFKASASVSRLLKNADPILREGYSITVYGTMDASSGGVTTNYSIDGGAVSQAVSPAGSGTTHKQLFWQSDTLQDGGQWVYDLLHPPRLTWGWLNTAYSTSRWRRWIRTLKLEKGQCGLITSKLWPTRLMPWRRALQPRHPQPPHLQQRT